MFYSNRLWWNTTFDFHDIRWHDNVFSINIIYKRVGTWRTYLLSTLWSPCTDINLTPATCMESHHVSAEHNNNMKREILLSAAHSHLSRLLLSRNWASNIFLLHDWARFLSTQKIHYYGKENLPEHRKRRNVTIVYIMINYFCWPVDSYIIQNNLINSLQDSWWSWNC